VPSLFRTKLDPKVFDIKQVEMNLFIEFESYSPFFHGIDSSINSWVLLSEMRHHGLPTRLIDWTGTFAVALYFALRGDVSKTQPCIRILNPLTLNKKSRNIGKILSIDYEYDYKKELLNPKIPFENPIAIYPLKSHSRLLAQDGFFTIHGTNEKSLDEIYPGLIKSFDIPKSIIPDAKKFFQMAKINEFSLYPDLDGLCRHMMQQYNFD